jgi:HprK-related kinase A
MRMEQGTGLRRWFRPYTFLNLDGEVPFRPLPQEEAMAMFEWCQNWCIETQAHRFLIFHAAIVERHGVAMMLSAPPGAGKSTLTAGLIGSGWRLLSDELTLIDPATGLAAALARPVGLKNQSIEVIRDFLPDAVIGPKAFDQTKGTIAHLRPPAASVERMDEPVLPRLVVFPRFQQGSPTRLEPYPRPDALLRLADSAFNYCEHGAPGFETLAALIEGCGCFEFTYSRLDEALAAFEALAAESSPLQVRG